MFQFYIPTRVLFGRGSLGELHKCEMPGHKALIVISGGKSVKANGYLGRLKEQLNKAVCEYVVYDKISPNPTLENITMGAEVARETGCDFIVGLGGGSSMDAAKAIAVMATNSGSYWDYNVGMTGKGLPLVSSPLPIICITTTAGTGSEVNCTAVTTNSKTYEKAAFKNEQIFPVISVVDSDLMISVPPLLTLYQGFDALLHAVESIINVNEHPVGEMFAIKAIEYVTKYLPSAVKDGENKEARDYVALASSFASFFMMCTSEHAMEHPLSAYHQGLQHGAGLLMICRAYHKNFVDKHACDEKYIKVAKAMGNEAANEGADFIDALDKLILDCNLGIPKMSDYGITRDEITKFTENALKTGTRLFLVDPIRLSEADVLRIYNESYE